MFRFGGKKNKDENNGMPQNGVGNYDKKFHSIIRVGAVLVILYILYLNLGGEGKVLGSDAAKVGGGPIAQQDCLTEDRINTEKAKLKADVKQAFEEMKSSPKFKKVTEFVSYIESEKDTKNGNVLATNDGYLLFVPNNLVKLDGKSPVLLKSEGKKFEFKVNFQEIPPQK